MNKAAELTAIDEMMRDTCKGNTMNKERDEHLAELRRIAAERGEDPTHNAFVAEYLRLSRASHDAKLADAVTVLAEQLEKVTRQRDALLQSLDDMIEYASAYIADHHISMQGYRQATHDRMDADLAKARSAIEKAKT